MATVVEDENFDRFLELAKMSPYDISLDGALLYMESQTNFINTMNIHILNEYDMFEFKDDIVDVFRTKNIFEAFHKLLNALSKLILKAIEIIFGVTKKFAAMSVDVSLDNKEFLEKYKRRLLALRGNPRVGIDNAYEMDIERLKGVGVLANDNFNATYDAYIRLLNFGQVRDETSTDEYENILADNIYDQRSRIIMAFTGSEPKNVSDEVYASELNDAMFGEKKYRSFYVRDALGIISSYDSTVDYIKKLSSVVSASLKKRLKTIADIRKKANTPENVKPIFVKQCNLLSGYTNQSINDIIATLNLMMDYAYKANRQAKVICIKALQQ